MSDIHIPAPIPEFLANLAQRYEVDRLVLFGSRARGDHRERSDIDLAVFGISAIEAGRLRLDLDELPTLLQFDLLCVGPNTEPQILKSIQKEGVVLYASKKM